MSANLPPRNQARFTLEEIARITNGVLLGDPNTPICGIITDTRLLENDVASTCGPLFVALRGANFDGHRFLHQARENGASALLIDKSALGSEISQSFVAVENTQIALGDLARFHRARFEIPLIGVTGSYGKTTTRALIEAALGASTQVLASQENFNNEIGVALTLLQLESAHTVAVIEMGMRGAGQIRYLAQMAAPTIGVITNIGPQHIELLGGLEEIARAKGELLEALPPDGIAILPADSEFLPLLRSLAPPRVATFGTAKNATVRVRDFQPTPTGEISFAMDLAGWRTTLPLPGAHNAVNAAAAMALLQEAYDIFGISLESAFARLKRVQVPGARMRIVEANSVTVIDDCYNAGPDSMRAALQVLAGFDASRRRVAILGAMRELGAWSDDEHRKLADLAIESGVQVLVGVGDETRAMMEAASENDFRGVLAWAAKLEDAVAIAHETVREGDVILVKGSRSVGLELVVSALDAA